MTSAVQRKVVSRWFPRTERSFASATFNNGNAVGGALSIPLVALVVAALGWRAAFAVAGGLGVLRAFGWWLYYRDPERHGQLRRPELEYIKAGQDDADGHAGSIAGIQNTAGNIAGIVSPLLLGVLMGSSGSFAVPLVTAGCVALLGAATYAFLLMKVEPLRLTEAPAAPVR